MPPATVAVQLHVIGFVGRPIANLVRVERLPVVAEPFLKTCIVGSSKKLHVRLLPFRQFLQVVLTQSAKVEPRTKTLAAKQRKRWQLLVSAIVQSFMEYQLDKMDRSVARQLVGTFVELLIVAPARWGRRHAVAVRFLMDWYVVQPAQHHARCASCK
mmetsp:Transcript_31027/g.60901  ORF Transcript_31027/g.60901 Transcript_31027/m.60901 type:complete len:157 (+) Transcript_31027:372-842(+)